MWLSRRNQGILFGSGLAIVWFSRLACPVIGRFCGRFESITGLVESASVSGNVNRGFFEAFMLLFASQTAPGGPAVILPALLITGLLIAASQAFVPKGDDQN